LQNAQHRMRSLVFALTHGFALAAIVIATLTFPVRGEGALAVAIPDEGLAKNFAYAWKVRASSADEARKEALAECRDAAKRNGVPADKCKIVEVFKGQCVAVANDRAKDWWSGWGVGKDEATARARAMRQCKVGGKACFVGDLDCDK
jgi:hypothetical protein